MDLKQRFLQVYSNLPLGMRKEIVLVFDKSPITWDVAFIEIDSDTPLATVILEKLSLLRFI